MDEEKSVPESGSTSSPEPTTGEAWDAVVARMNDLSAAVGRWTRAAANEPDTKDKLDQFRAGIDDIGMKADAALGRAVRSEAGRAIGDAAHAVGDVAAPHVKNLFAELADIFEKAARKVDEATQTPAKTPPATEEPVQSPQGPPSNDAE
jgi:hypothetical protein